MEKYICDCCGYKVLDEPQGSYQICPICFWQDDGYIDQEGYYDTGANEVPLSIAQVNYRRFGAVSKRVLPFVRKPKEDEVYIGALKHFKERNE